MASIIRIKRSTVSGNPATLAAGELAYSALTDNGSNGGDRLYIGIGTETGGNAANHFVIGGKYFTDKLDHSAGTLTASSAILVDSNSKIDNLKVDNLDLNGNTISTTDTNGNILLTPNGTGKVVITNPFIGDDATSLAEYIFDTVGGAITAGNGITITNNDGSNTSTVAIDTAVTVDLNTAQILTNKTISGASNTLSNIANGSLTNSAVTINGTSISLGGSGTVTAAAGTLTGTTLNSTVVTSSLTAVGTISTGVWQGTAIGNAYLANSAVTIGSTNIALGATSTSLTGLTQIDVDNITINGNEISSTDTNGNISLNPNGSGTVAVNSARVTGLADPVDAQDAATKAYVDARSAGLDPKASVRAATTANITLSNTQTVDGIALDVGDRILVKDQSTASQNGIYVVASSSWARSTDMDAPAEMTSGVFFFVEEGTANADAGFVITTDGGAITVGVDAVNFTQFSGAGQIVAGDGLAKSGNTLSVNVAASGGIEISADALQIKSTLAGDGLTYSSGVIAVGGTTNRIAVSTDAIDISTSYAGQTSIVTLGTVTTGTWSATAIGATKGGTGLTTYATGDLLYASGTNTLAKLSAATDGQVLQLSSGVPTWGDIDGGTY
tara:strand:+ start:353 stop:2197 length:1845 start_codon:yes stop_codon:yes gene_type:complete